MIELANLWVGILSFFISFFSLIATIVLTIVIYRLQKNDEEKKDRERKEDIERKARERDEELARNFIIDNQSEINLLPWCAIASNVKDLPALQIWRNKREYSHQIYLKFDKQPEGVKKEILRQENILLSLPKTSDWVSEYLNTLAVDAYECGLSSEKHCFLYDNGKYFHRGISDYWGEKTTDIARIEMPNIPIKKQKNPLGNLPPDFDDYIVETVQRKFGRHSYLEEDAMPALDFADIFFSNNQKMFVLCMMQFVRGFSLSVCSNTGRNESFGTNNDRQIKTFEDYYYESLLELYLAYHPRQ